MSGLDATLTTPRRLTPSLRAPLRPARQAERAAAELAPTGLAGSPVAWARAELGVGRTRSALVAADAAALAAVCLGVWFAFGSVGTAGEAGIVMGLLLGVYAFVGGYRDVAIHPAMELRRMAGLTGLVGVVYVVAAEVVEGPERTLALVTAALAATVAVPLARLLCRVYGGRAAWWGVPTAVIAYGSNGGAVLDTLRRWPELGLRPVALLQDAPAAEAGDLLTGGVREAAGLARRTRVSCAVVSATELSHGELAVRLERLARFFDRVIVIEGRPGARALWKVVPAPDTLLGYSIRDGEGGRLGALVKRTLDVLGAGFGLLVLSPLLLALAVAIRLDSPGPVFFRQRRMGRRGQCFTVLKFRTMHPDAERRLATILAADPARAAEYAAFHKLADDPRVTAVGRLLRRLSLDELPQLINVLRGDMSLVGPRAYVPREISDMGGLERVVLQSTPGLTGLWQVSGRNALSFEERVRIDVHYVQNASVWLDLYILARTVPVVISGEGAA